MILNIWFDKTNLYIDLIIWNIKTLLVYSFEMFKMIKSKLFIFKKIECKNL